MNIGLPKNLALETEILSMMMNNDYCLNECMTELDSKDFYDSKNSTLFETIKILWTQEKPISESTIYSILGKNDIDKVGGISYLSEIRTSFVTSEGIKERIAILKDIEQRRELVKISDRDNRLQKELPVSKVIVKQRANYLNYISKLSNILGKIDPEDDEEEERMGSYE